jgi:hypothetical protein
VSPSCNLELCDTGSPRLLCVCCCSWHTCLRRPAPIPLGLDRRQSSSFARCMRTCGHAANVESCALHGVCCVRRTLKMCLRDRGACLSPAGTAPKQLYPFDKRATLRTDDIEGASVNPPPPPSPRLSLTIPEIDVDSRGVGGRSSGLNLTTGQVALPHTLGQRVHVTRSPGTPPVRPVPLYPSTSRRAYRSDRCGPSCNLCARAPASAPSALD